MFGLGNLKKEHLTKRENHEECDNSPVKYTAPLDVFEMEDSAPLAYVMDGAKIKGSSPNQGFSLKDVNTIQNLQGTSKAPSEGSFKTKSQNIYASFDSPLEYRAPSVLKDSGVTEGETALAAADRRMMQNAQGLQNAATVTKMIPDIVDTVKSVATLGLDKKAEKGGKALLKLFGG